MSTDPISSGQYGLGGINTGGGAGGTTGGGAGGVTPSDPSTDYDPGAVQTQLQTIMAGYGPGNPMPEGVVTYVMYLMQEYGLQVVGQDANLQSNVNKYMGQIKELYTDLNSANGWTSASGTPDPSIDFKSTLDSLLHSLSTDTFFTSGQGNEMVSQITAALTGMEKWVTPGTTPISGEGTIGVSGQGGLEALWQEYNGTPGTASVTGTPGNPADMSSMNSYLGQITQQYTGLSASIKATTTSDSSTQSTEQDTMNNWLKKLNSTNLYFLQQQKTQ